MSSRATATTFTCEHCHSKVETNKKRFINCGHYFCINCIEKNASKKCPTCGGVFDEFTDTPPGQPICSICQDVMGGTKGHLLCCHSFCFGCITEWFEHSGCCPVCKNMSTEISREAPPSLGLEEESYPPPVHIPLDTGIPGSRKGGSFSCECGKKWRSEYAYKNVEQKCGKCRRSVKPFKLKQPKKLTNRKPEERKEAHKRHLCGMCEKIGSDCSQMKFTKKDLDKFCRTLNL